MDYKDILRITGIPVIAASLCCLSPVVLVLFGLSTVSVGASLADTLYGTYKWAFRTLGLLLLAASLIFYFRSRGICTLDQVKRDRQKIINVVLVSLISAVIGYFLFLYGVVEYAGILLGLW